MNRTILFSTILFIVALIGGSAMLITGKGNPSGGALVFYYGEGCPHCATVEEYFDKQGITERFEFEQKEVYYDKENAAELVKQAEACKMPTDEIGIPLLWTGSECLVGDVDIINFFEDKVATETE